MTRRMMACVLVGVVSGLGACLFYWMLQGGIALFLGKICHFVPPEAAGEPSPFTALLVDVPRNPIRWAMVLMPALGGLVSGWIVFTWAPEAEGHGTDSAITSFHRLGGRIRARVPFIKTIASAITLGTGGSGGREGPIAQIGAGFGSFLATQLHLPDRERRLLVLAGLGSGIGAIFKAPLAGALFAGEVLYNEEELEYEALVPATVASIVSYSIFASFFGWQPLFLTPDVGFSRPLDLIGYGILGVVSAGGGWLYIKCFYGTRDLFRKLQIPLALKPMIGGLVTGLIGWFIPQALATSYGQVQLALDLKLAVGPLLVLALAKIVTTSFSIGSGGSGGVFGPAMVIGGALGGAVGIVCQHLGLIQNPATMVLVGMAGFFSGAANTPISTIIMVSEMTGNYNLLVPSMCTCAIAMLLLRKHSIYENQVPNRQCSPAHSGELAIDILQALPVRDWMNREFLALSASTKLPELACQMSDAGHTRHAVLDAEGRVVGILDVRDVLCMLTGDTPSEATAGEVADSHFTTIEPQCDLHEALALLDREPHGMLLVMTHADDRRLLGVLRRQDILHAYNEASQRMLKAFHRSETGAVHLPADVTVGEAMTVRFDSVPPELPLGQLERRFQESGHHGFPVVEGEGQLLGVVTLSDLHRAGSDPDLRAGDICTRQITTCYPYETLVEALRKFGQREIGRLPVVDPGEPSRIVGVLRRSDVIATFARSAELEQQDEESAVVHALDVPQSRFIEFTVRRGSPALEQRVRDLSLPSECLLVSIRRGAQLLVPHGETRIQLGDRVTVLCSLEARKEVQAAFGSRQEWESGLNPGSGTDGSR